MSRQLRRYVERTTGKRRTILARDASIERLFVDRPRNMHGRPTRVVQPSARELFVGLRVRLLASRPIVAMDSHGEPIYGKPTFRNVYNQKGELE